MKKLIFINGPAGVGKTTTARLLSRSVNRSACFDGDWSWMTFPWDFSAESCRMAEENTAFVLRNFFGNPCVDCVVYCWVTHRQDIAERVFARLADIGLALHRFTLFCSDDALRERMRADGRLDKHIALSLQRSHLSRDNDGACHIDTTSMNIADTVRLIRTRAGIPPEQWHDGYLQLAE